MANTKKGGAKRRYNRRKGYRKNKIARIGQNLGKDIFWYKKASDLQAASPSGTMFLVITPGDVYPIPAFVNTCRAYEQYKVLKVIAKFYPAFVGSETSTSAVAGYRRGNVITWVDQPPLGLQPQSGEISKLMGFPSSRLHQSRATIKRWMTRPSGGRFADWAYIRHPTALGVPDVAPDDWNSQIRIFGDNFSVNPTTQKPYFFVEYMFQVVFRSKYRGGTP